MSEQPAVGDKLAGYRRTTYAVWEATLRCNLACRHCGSRAGRNRPEELPTAEAIDLIGQLADLGIGEITFVGGEPLLRHDFAELVREVDRRGMVCSLLTGGYTVT